MADGFALPCFAASILCYSQDVQVWLRLQHSAHLEVAKGAAADGGQVHVGDVGHVERIDLLGVLEDLVGDPLRRWLAAVVVELDAKVLLRAACQM